LQAIEGQLFSYLPADKGRFLMGAIGFCPPLEVRGTKNKKERNH